MTTPSSQVPRPPPLWPPPRIASSRLVITSEADRRGDVVGVRAARDQRRPPVDHRVEDDARLLVVGVLRTDQPAAEVGKLSAGGVRGCDGGAHGPFSCLG